MKKMRLPWADESEKDAVHSDQAGKQQKDETIFSAADNAEFQHAAGRETENEEETDSSADIDPPCDTVTVNNTEDPENPGTIDNPENTAGSRKTPKTKRSSEKKSLWKQTTFFTKLSLFLILISVLMAVTFWFMHRIPSLAVSLIQIIGLLIALLFHKKKLHSAKKWLNRITILLFVLLLMVGNIGLSARKIVHSRRISDRNAVHQSEEALSGQMILMPLGTDDCIGRDYSEIYKALKDAGFTNVDSQPVEDLTYEEADKIGTVASVLIGAESSFLKDQAYDKASRILINYHAYQNCDLNLKLDFNGNLLFNRYDVDLYVNDSLKATLEHGVDSSYLFQQTPGTCTLRFEKAGDSSISVAYQMEITQDTEIGLSITCGKNGITLKELNSQESEEAQKSQETE